MSQLWYNIDKTESKSLVPKFAHFPNEKLEVQSWTGAVTKILLAPFLDLTLSTVGLVSSNLQGDIQKVTKSMAQLWPHFEAQWLSEPRIHNRI